MALNTKKLLAAAGSPTGESIQVEYHFLSWRELYDKRFITADRYSSGTAEWVLYGDRHFYTLSVISRPFYAMPQELCLAFNCFTTTKTFGRGASTGPPFDEVAVEFAALLSVLAREALVPLGPRRIGDKPIRFESPYVPPPNQIRGIPRPRPLLGIGMPTVRSLKTMRRRETTRAMRAVQMSAGDKDRSGFHHVRLGNEVNNNGRSHDKYNYKPVLFWVVFDKVSCKTENLLHFSEKFEDLYLPDRPKRRTTAEIAREAGLGPLVAAPSELGS